MAVFKSFKALRPAKEKASAVAALPYDVVTEKEARCIGEKNPDSFLHVDRAEIDLPEDINPYDCVVYEKASETLKEMEKKGILVQDGQPYYYLYELIRNQVSQTGMVGCCAIDDYRNNIIKKHELTREEKEQDRICHVDVCDANTGPIFLACRYTEELLEFMNNWKKDHAPVYDFTAEDDVIHRVWVIENAEDIAWIQAEFEKIPSLYIADGHHRAASAVKVGMKRRAANPDYTGEEEFNYFLSVVFPYEQLTILPYQRVVADLNGLTEKAFLSAVKFHYELMLVPGFPCKPVEPHCMGMYLNGEWYHLKAWAETLEKRDVVGKLDVSLLQDKILRPVLGIEDPRTSNRIQFIGGNQSLKKLQEIADETGGVAFAMYPTSIEELMDIADEGKVMPPKSTWFEPKLRSGLFIHKLSE